VTADSFSKDSAELAAVLFSRRPVERRLYDSVRSSLSRIVLARYRVLGVDEILNVVDETITRLIRETEDAASPLSSPSSWLVTVALNLARDQVRRIGRQPKMAEEPASDDETARLLDRNASTQAVDAGMAEAVRRRDDVVIAVATTWLDLAEEIGAAPASRLVAERCGYSHTTVNDALSRFRDYVALPL
jgi:DNA-directed RNA polymerase specialized sigma24 family protein